MPKRKDNTPPEDVEKFEEFVAAALKVDPKGLSGKHRKPDDAEQVHPPKSKR